MTQIKGLLIVITTSTNTNTNTKTQLVVGPNPKFGIIAPDSVIERTAAALEKNGMRVIIVENGEQAKAEVLNLVPHGSHVYTTTSRTLDSTGIAPALNDSENYRSIRKAVFTMDRATEMREIRKLQSTHDFVVGSVHAVTEKGEVLVASGSGSQLPSYAYGGDKVIWVVGAQKIVKDIDEGLDRLQEYSLPMESERMQQLYGRNSTLAKILIVKREGVAGRVTVILVKENLGF